MRWQQVKLKKLDNEKTRHFDPRRMMGKYTAYQRAAVFGIPSWRRFGKLDFFFFFFFSKSRWLPRKAEWDESFQEKEEDKRECDPIDEEYCWRPSSFLLINHLKTIVRLRSFRDWVGRCNS